MTTQHTPGPWFHVGGTDRRSADYIRVVGEEAPGSGVAVAQVCRGGPTERAANACLIAAAPELLDALQRIAEHPITRADELTIEGAREIARAALARALPANGDISGPL